MNPTVKYKKLDPRAQVPAYATPGAAAADLCAVLDEPLTLAPMQRTLVPTGLASDYRGELRVPMVNLSDTAYTIQPGERVAQLCIAPVWQAGFAAAEELSDTDRGTGGFGSTGK